MKWKSKLINEFIGELKNDPEWAYDIKKIEADSNIGIHLAIFNEPFLTLILSGEKKYESRFSKNKISPFRKITDGDIVILKEAGGFVQGVFIAGKVVFIPNLDTKKLDEIKIQFSDQLCTSYDANFWDKRVEAKYASLIEVKKIRKLKPFKASKRDRAGWSILKENKLFEDEYCI